MQGGYSPRVGFCGSQVVVDWDAASRTAIFIWRGSITQQDWLQVDS